MAPHVSVLLPCHNAAGTLDACLASLCDQTFTDFELLAIDDGSTDATRAELERWARRDSRIQVQTQAHSGIIPALNHALSLASGTYVARMDADDWAYPTRLAAQVALFEADPTVAVVGCMVRATPAASIHPGLARYLSWLNALLTHEAIMLSLFTESPLVHPSVMIRRAWVDRVGGYLDYGWPEDYDLWMRLAQAGARFAKVPEILLDWFNHPGRLTWTDRRYQRSQFLKLKAHYLPRMLLPRYDAVIVWGAGSTGRRLSRLLMARGVPVVGFVDPDPRKIGGTCHERPIVDPSMLPALWRRGARPVVLVAVAAEGARPIIQAQLVDAGLREGHEWWSVA